MGRATGRSCTTPEEVLALLRDGAGDAGDPGEVDAGQTGDVAAFEVVESGIRGRRVETPEGAREALDTVVLLSRA